MINTCALKYRNNKLIENCEKWMEMNQMMMMMMLLGRNNANKFFFFLKFVLEMLPHA